MFGFLRRRRPDLDDLIRRADALRDARAFGAAADAYAAILPLAPHRFDLIVQHGNMLKDAGRRDEAALAYRHALERMPGDADINLQLGHLARLDGDHDEARRCFRRALQLDPRNRSALHELRSLGDAAGIAAGLSFEAAADLVAGNEARESIAIPPECWPALRSVWDLPHPPRSDIAIHVFVSDRPAALSESMQVAKLRAQSHALWTFGFGEPGRDCTAAEDSRFRAMPPPDAWVLTCLDGELLHPSALAWFAYAAGTSSFCWMADSEIVDNHDAPLLPLLRDPPDIYALEAGGLPTGPVLFAPDDWAIAARDGIAERILALARLGKLALIPLPLTSIAAAPRGVTSLKAADAPGRIAVIVPTRNNGPDVEDFIASMRQTAEVPADVTFAIVDNGSDTDATAAALNRIAATPGAQVIRIDEPFNWCRLNNAAAATSDADILLFANDDMRMLSKGWDRVLQQRLASPAVGGVGAKLLYPDGTVQHAGMLAGWTGELIHDGLDAPAGDPGYGGRWVTPHAVSAVTGAFLAVRRTDFEQLGGFDAVRFAVSFGDVDFCYRLRAAGLTALYEPAIVAEHFESKTRGRDDQSAERQARHNAERASFVDLWGPQTDDPWLNPFWVATGKPRRFLATPPPETVLKQITSPGGDRKSDG